MKHARQDYDRFQDPAGLIPEDEPVMLFRAQDKYFDKVLRYYRQLVEHDGGDNKILDAITKHLALAKLWPKKKSPDMPTDARIYTKPILDVHPDVYGEIRRLLIKQGSIGTFDERGAWRTVEFTDFILRTPAKPY